MSPSLEGIPAMLWKGHLFGSMTLGVLKCICASWEDKYKFIRAYECINTAFFIIQAKGHLVKGGDLLKESQAR